jgi:hypothetical protein
MYLIMILAISAALSTAQLKGLDQLVPMSDRAAAFPWQV